MHFGHQYSCKPNLRAIKAALFAIYSLLVMASPSVQAQQLLYAPVSGSVTSNFGWRSDPMGAGSRFHAGVDIAASQGTPVYAPQNAYVAYSGLYKGYGNVVVLDHGYGLYTLYGHASVLYVQVGQAVLRGQPIAAVGSTGRSTGPHLHFEVHQNGQYVDPLVYLSYLAKNDTQIAHLPQPAQISAPPSQPIQVSLAKGSQDAQQAITQSDEALADSIPPQIMMAQANSSQSIGKTSKGVSVPIHKPAAKTAKSGQKANLKAKSIASHTSKRVGRYLASSAIQVVSGKRVNWVRF